MARLRDCGLVEGRVQGRSVYYSLARPELMDMLAQTEVPLGATGNAVSLCPNYGVGSAGTPDERERTMSDACGCSDEKTGTESEKAAEQVGFWQVSRAAAVAGTLHLAAWIASLAGGPQWMAPLRDPGAAGCRVDICSLHPPAAGEGKDRGRDADDDRRGRRSDPR